MGNLGPFWLIICGVAIFMMLFTIINLTSLGLLKGALVVGWFGLALMSLFEVLFGEKEVSGPEPEDWDAKQHRIRRGNARRKRGDRF